jgi:hypothetical protein
MLFLFIVSSLFLPYRVFFKLKVITPEHTSQYTDIISVF